MLLCVAVMVTFQQPALGGTGLLSEYPGVEVHTDDNDGYLLNNEDFIRDVQAAIDSVYNYNYEASLEILEKWMDRYPDHPAWVFWEGLPVWWEIVNDLESTGRDDKFISIMENADRQSDVVLRRDRRNLDAMVIKSLANGFLARVYSNRAKWYKSFGHGRTSVNLLFNIEQMYPDIADLQFGLGLYKYFTAYLSEEYRLVRAVSWMLPGGDKEDGLKRLQNAAENSAFMKPESQYFLGHINLHYERDYSTAREYLTGLVERYPDNPFFNRLMLRNYFRNREMAKAWEFSDILMERFAKSDPATLEELYTIRGQLHARRFENETALEYFEKALELGPQFENPEKRQFQTQARFLKARILLRENLNEEARQELDTIIRARPDSPFYDQARQLRREL